MTGLEESDSNRAAQETANGSCWLWCNKTGGLKLKLIHTSTVGKQNYG